MKYQIVITKMDDDTTIINTIDCCTLQEANETLLNSAMTCCKVHFNNWGMVCIYAKKNKEIQKAGINEDGFHYYINNPYMVSVRAVEDNYTSYVVTSNYINKPLFQSNNIIDIKNYINNLYKNIIDIPIEIKFHNNHYASFKNKKDYDNLIVNY